MKYTMRMDDMDPRIRVKDLKPLHEEFVKRGIPMTIAVNNFMGHAYHFDPEVLAYVNGTDPASWDIQLHGLEHDRLWAMTEMQFYASMFANLGMTKRDFIHARPTILYPPWNETSSVMERVCKDLGLEIKISKKTIREFLKDWNTQSETIFYWHWWTPDDCRDIPAVLDKVIKLSH